MSNLDVKKSITLLTDQLAEIKRGDPLLAETLAAAAKFINENFGGVLTPRQIIRSGGKGATIQMKVVALKTDYLECNKWDGSTQGTDLFLVALPFLLRRTDFDSIPGTGAAQPERDGRTFKYTTDSERVATRIEDGKEETQVIVPKYVVGDVIYVDQDIVGGTASFAKIGNEEFPLTFLDQNKDSRFWSRKSGS